MEPVKRPKVLYISHDATLTGAPISFIGLLGWLKQNRSWETRILLREREGPLLESFSRLGQVDFYFHGPPVIGGRLAFLRHVCYCWRSLMHVRHRRRVRAELTAWQPDLIYANTAMNGDVIVALGMPHVPVVVHVRELEWYLGRLDPARLQAFEQVPSLYFAVSDAVKENLIRRHGISPSKIEIAPDAIVSEDVLQRAGEVPVTRIRERLRISPEDIVVGNVGVIDLRKGSDLFVDIAAEVLRRLNGQLAVRFIWIGEGPYQENIKERIRVAGLEERVWFVGPQRNPYPYINCFDVTLMCSREDPFPRVNLEAGALGKPIVAFGFSGGSREFIEDDCGFVVPELNIREMAERVIQLVKDAELRAQMGHNAHRKTLMRYDVSVVASDVARILEAKFGFAQNASCQRSGE